MILFCAASTLFMGVLCFMHSRWLGHVLMAFGVAGTAWRLASKRGWLEFGVHGLMRLRYPKACRGGWRWRSVETSIEVRCAAAGLKLGTGSDPHLRPLWSSGCIAWHCVSGVFCSMQNFSCGLPGPGVCRTCSYGAVCSMCRRMSKDLGEDFHEMSAFGRMRCSSVQCGST